MSSPPSPSKGAGAATDGSSLPSPLPDTDGAGSMSSVQTTISATISESASDDDDGLAGVDSWAAGFGAGDARPEGLTRDAPLTVPVVIPSPDRLSWRFLVLADFPIVWERPPSRGLAMGAVCGTVYQIRCGGRFRLRGLVAAAWTRVSWRRALLVSAHGRAQLKKGNNSL